MTSLVEDPTSETKRRIYADWLEEHGDPWAKVFRSGDFCGAMGWRPQESIWSYDWTGKVHEPDEAAHVLPAAVYALLPDRYYGLADAVAAANVAFVRAWHTGWRPAQDGFCEACATGQHVYHLGLVQGSSEDRPSWKLPYRRELRLGQMYDSPWSLVWCRLFSQSGISARLNNHQLTVQLHTHARVTAVSSGQKDGHVFTLSPGQAFSVRGHTFVFEEAEA